MLNIQKIFCLGEIPFAGKYLQDSHLLWIQTFRGWKHSGFCRWNIIFRFLQTFQVRISEAAIFHIPKICICFSVFDLSDNESNTENNEIFDPTALFTFLCLFYRLWIFLRQKCVSEYLAFDAFDLQANNEIFWPAATGTRVLRNLIPSRAQLPLSVSTPQNALILQISLWW